MAVLHEAISARAHEHCAAALDGSLLKVALKFPSRNLHLDLRPLREAGLMNDSGTASYHQPLQASSLLPMRA